MKEFFEFLQTVGERLRNRVFGPFFIAFLFWNWKPILMIIASKEPIEVTIYEIEACNYFNVYNVIVYPLIISLVYSSIQPFLSYYLGRLIKWPIKKSIDANIEYTEIRKRGEVKLAHLEFQIQDAKAGTLRVEELNNKLTEYEKQIKTYTEDNQQIRSEISILESKNLDLSNKYRDTKATYSSYLLELIQSRYRDNEKWEVVKALELLGRGDVDLEEISSEVKSDLVNFKIVDSLKETGKDKRAFFLTTFGQQFITNLNFK